MKITCFANFADPQTYPFFTTLYEKTGHQFLLAATEPFEQQLLEYGYEDLNESVFVEKLYMAEDPLKKAEELARESDVLIYGHCPVEYFNLAVKSGKTVFRLSQHIYRDGNMSAVPFKWKLSYFIKHTLALLGKPVYLMCLGTYTARDFNITASYRNKMYEFGEFTPTVQLDIDQLMQRKQSELVKICWINTFHEWFHPETAIDLIEAIMDRPFEFKLVGNNTMPQELKEKYLHSKAHSKIKVIENAGMEQVNEILKESNIFLMTSDHNEGWGNILNTAMNYGCACVVSNAVGSSKMIEQGRNGLLYRYDRFESLVEKVTYLLDHPEKIEQYGRNAYSAIINEWNGVIAGERFYELAENLINGKESPFTKGICSPARIVNQLTMDETTESLPN